MKYNDNFDTNSKNNSNTKYTKEYAVSIVILHYELCLYIHTYKYLVTKESITGPTHIVNTVCSDSDSSNSNKK